MMEVKEENVQTLLWVTWCARLRENKMIPDDTSTWETVKLAISLEIQEKGI
jgi:hypothetical protein